MPEDNDKKIPNEDINSILGSLNLKELSKQYEVDVTDELAAPQQESEETDLPNEPMPGSKLKTKLANILGTLLLIFSLIIYGIPMVVGKVKRQLSVVMCLLLSLVIIFCSYYIAGSFLFAKAAAEQAKFEAQEVTEPAEPFFVTNPLLPDTISELKPITQEITYPEGMLEKYKAAYAINPDVVGHLRIPNTSIDTLLLQSSTNTHYLRYDFYDRYTQYGNAFVDYRNKLDVLNQNTIIYGHTTQSKLQVFNDLYKYMDYDFYVQNPVIEFGTIYKDYRWKIFAIYITGVDKSDDNGYLFYYIHTEINEQTFTGFLSQIMQRSRFFTDIGVTDSDNILTLSTCVYDNNFSGYAVDSRLVVVAKLMDDGESDETDPVQVIDNPNYRRPQIWYNHFGKTNPYANSENWEQ